MVELIDTHSHLFVEEFDDDRALAVQRAREAGVTRLFMPNINLASVEPMLAMCDKYAGYCFPMLGLHPTELGDGYRGQLRLMEQMLERSHPFKAIGEVGLDFYWDDSKKSEQIEVFEHQILWAQKYDLPLVIHSRKAFDELYALMDSHREMNLRGIFHCFEGDEAEARALLSFRGFMLGVGGTVTYKKSLLPQVLPHVPLSRIVLETDSPYLAPVPYRGKRNESAYIVETAKKVAQLYGVTFDEMAHVTTSNAKIVFGF